MKMRKNFGSAIVKKAITLAMAVMLVFAPATKVAAAEANITITEEQINEAKEQIEQAKEQLAQAQKDAQEATNSMSNSLESAAADSSSVLVGAIEDELNKLDKTEYPDAYLTNEEKNLLTNLEDAIAGNKEADKAGVNFEGLAEDVIDDVCGAIETEVENSKNNVINSADAAADNTVAIVGGVKEDTKEVLDYVADQDELLNHDQEIVAGVEGNTNNVIETVKADGSIIVKTDDDTTTETTLTDFVAEQSDIAVDAAKEANDVLANITSGADVDVTAEKEKLDNAVATATAAKDNAEAAVTAAKAVLAAETEKLGLLEEDLPAVLDTLKTLTEKTEAGETLTAAESKMMADYQAIADAQKTVTDCAYVSEQAKTVLDKIVAAEETFVTNVTNAAENMQALMDSIADKESEEYKTANDAYITIKTVLDTYQTTEMEDDSTLETYKERFDYAADKAKALLSAVNDKVVEANTALEESQKAYLDAVGEYKALMAELEKHTSDSVNATIKAIEDKLAAAKTNLAVAELELEEAKDAVKDAENAKKLVEDYLNTPVETPDDNKDDNKNDSPASSGSNAPSSSTPATTTIPDDSVATASAPGLVEIIDEAAATTDSVPKTSDSTPLAWPFAMAGCLAMCGAFFMNIKKRFER